MTATAPRDRTERPPAPRGRPRHPDTDRAILAATFRQLVEVGYGGLSVEAVAAAAGVAKTTIYRRYPTKRDLVIAALQVEVPLPEISTTGDLRTSLRDAVHTVVHRMVDSGALRILGSLLVEANREPELLAMFRERLLEPRRNLIADLLQAGIERGELRPDLDPLVVTEMLAGATIAHHAILGQPLSAEWIDALVDHIWAATRAPGRD
jgi:AcrR family transcriptional regulator